MGGDIIIPWQIEIISFSFFHYWWMIYFYGFRFHKIHSLSLKLKPLKSAVCNWRGCDILHISCSVLCSELFSRKVLLIEQYHDVQYGKTEGNICNLYLGLFFHQPQKPCVTSHRALSVIVLHLYQLLEVFYLCDKLDALELREGCSVLQSWVIINRQMFISSINRQMFIFSSIFPQYILGSWLVWLHFSYSQWDGPEFPWKLQLLLKIAFLLLLL